METASPPGSMAKPSACGGLAAARCDRRERRSQVTARSPRVLRQQHAVRGRRPGAGGGHDGRGHEEDGETRNRGERRARAPRLRRAGRVRRGARGRPERLRRQRRCRRRLQVRLRRREADGRAQADVERRQDPQARRARSIRRRRSLPAAPSWTTRPARESAGANHASAACTWRPGGAASAVRGVDGKGRLSGAETSMSGALNGNIVDRLLQPTTSGSMHRPQTAPTHHSNLPDRPSPPRPREGARTGGRRFARARAPEQPRPHRSARRQPGERAAGTTAPSRAGLAKAIPI